ncbi:MAG TPA: methyltransferase domain-containing protein [Actinomycetota bacterium]|jgi:predicted nicotinamide N-methyase|nr:methyltransferase domain-containing protein [Actinomycetota bacterium]
MDSRPEPSVAPPLGLPPGAASDVVEETVRLPGRAVRMLRPRDGDAILDELLAEDDPDEDRLPFWAQLWPSGTTLAQAIASRPLTGRRVLELGCGLGLVAVTAALAGATVLAVDRSPEAISFAAVNAARNGVTLQTAVAAFAEPERLLREAPWDLVLAADVLYEQRNVPVLLWLLPRLVDPTGEVWLADPGRAMLARFLAGVDATGWRREQVASDPETVAIHRLCLTGRDAAGRPA